MLESGGYCAALSVADVEVDPPEMVASLHIKTCYLLKTYSKYISNFLSSPKHFTRYIYAIDTPPKLWRPS